MYQNKDKAEERIKIIEGMLEALYKERKHLEHNLTLLEKEKSMLNKLLEIYELESKGGAFGRQQD